MTVARRTALYAGASATTVATTLLTLPLATRVLDPSDYGVFALATSFFTVGGVVASAGHAQMIAANLGTVDVAERRSLISSMFLSAVGVGAVVGLVTATALLLAGHWGLGSLDEVPTAGTLLAALTVTLTAPSYLAADVLAIDERAGAAAGLVMVQSVFGAGALLLSLFAFDLGLVSLFLGAAAGSAAAFCTILLTLHGDLASRPSRRWLIALRRVAPSVLAGSAADTIRIVLERYLVSSRVGLSGLGIYAHSQQYRAYLLQGVNPLSRSLYPVTLAEARDLGGQFPRTGRAWSLAQLAVIPAGIVLIFFGHDLIGALTNGKFDRAAGLAALWMVVVAVQLTGRPQNITLLAHGKGHVAANLLAASIALSVVALLLLLPAYGLRGAVVAQLVQQVVYRAGLTWAARRVRPVPFQDWPAVAAVACLGLAYAFARGRHGSGTNAAVVAIALAAWAAACAVVYFRPRRQIDAGANPAGRRR